MRTPTSSDPKTAKSGQNDPDSPELKFSLKGQRFDSIEGIRANMRRVLNTLKMEPFNLVELGCLGQCINTKLIEWQMRALDTKMITKIETETHTRNEKFEKSNQIEKL